MKARHVRGDYLTVPYLNSGAALNAGDVIAFGRNRAAVVHPVGIAAGATGELVVKGGEWELAKSGSSGPVIATGEEVAWITSTNLATDIMTGNVSFGFCTKAAGAS